MIHSPIDWNAVEVLSFDCYGTLIDWEQGILASLRRHISAAGVADDDLLEAYAEAETRLEATAWRPYRQILSESLAEVCRRFGATPTGAEVVAFGDSVAGWPAFPDSRTALARLRERFGLAVITNCDDDLFELSNAKLGHPFGWAITAEQARAYKPAPRSFELAFERIGCPREAMVHVAQSLYHDHVPAAELGLRTVWIDRRHDRPGFGSTPPAQAKPNMVAPNLAAFADLALATN